MRVLLISANRERMPYPVAPLGLAYVSQALKEAGHEVRVIDLCFCADVAQELSKGVAEFSPEMVGISLRNLDNLTFPNPISYLGELEETVSILRRVTNAPIVIGGSGFSLAPIPIMERLGVDFGVVGEGEVAMKGLLASLARGISPEGIPGVIVKGVKGFLPPRPLASFHFPDRDLLAGDRYLREGGMANIQTKRGCPFACLYCTYPLLEGTGVRVRDVEEVVEELKGMQQQGVDYCYFVDDIFNYPPDYAVALLRQMIAAGVAMHWTAFVNPRFLTADMVSLMADAGCQGVELGVDAGSEGMLRSYRKGFSLEEIEQAACYCRDGGLPFAIYLLLGGPGEDEATLKESFSFVDRLSPTAVIFMLGIRIYPYTPLAAIAVREGVISEGDDLVEPRFYISPLIGSDRLIELVTEAAMARRGWIVPGLEINISQPLIEGMRKFGVRGPLWEFAGRMKRARMHPLR